MYRYDFDRIVDFSLFFKVLNKFSNPNKLFKKILRAWIRSHWYNYFVKKRHTVQIKIHLFLYPSNIFLYNINIFFLNYTCGIIIFVENASCHFWLVRIRPCNKQLKKKIIFWYPSVFWSSTSKYPKINGFIKWLMKTNLPINIQRNTEPKRNQDIENCATCNEVYLQSFNPVDNSISHNSFHT